MTINQSRGMNKLIGDRFDLTLECIKRFYINEKNPLEKTLQLYRNYFELFKNFKGFIDLSITETLWIKINLLNSFYPLIILNQIPYHKIRMNIFFSWKNLKN